MLQFDKNIDSDHLSYYVRVFGNDIRAGDFYQFNIEQLKSRFNFLDWMIELSRERNIDVIKNWQFLDASLTIPTGTGMLCSVVYLIYTCTCTRVERPTVAVYWSKASNCAHSAYCRA